MKMFVAYESHRAPLRFMLVFLPRKKTNFREGREPGLVNRANKW